MAKKPEVHILNTAYRIDQLRVYHGPLVLFLGRSNVGKSSLLNAIFGKDLAHISKKPGKTRSINLYQMGHQIFFADLPGYGFAKRAKMERQEWHRLIHEFFEQLPAGALAYLLLDSKRNLEKEEFELINSLQGRVSKLNILLTKSDRLNQSERMGSKRELNKLLKSHPFGKTLTYRFVSAHDGEGIKETLAEIWDYEKAFGM